jgi:hypothetical protein
VKSAPGKRVDMRNSTEDRVSMVMACPDTVIHPGPSNPHGLHRLEGVTTCHIVCIDSSCSGLVLLREVNIVHDVPQNKQMADKKYFPIKSTLHSKQVCRILTHQRNSDYPAKI